MGGLAVVASQLLQLAVVKGRTEVENLLVAVFSLDLYRVLERGRP